MALEGADGVLSNLVSSHGLTAVRARESHGRLQERTLKEHTIVGQGLVHSSQYALLDLSGGVDVVITIHEDLGLHNGDQTALLHGTGVPGKAPGILLDAQRGGGTIRGDLEHGTPLGETSTLLVVLLGTLYKAIKASAPGLHGVGTRERLKASVDLNSGDHAHLLEALYEGGAISMVLEEGLLVEDGTRDVLAQVGGSEEEA